MKKKKIPMRRCIASGEMMPKKELVRIVRNAEVLHKSIQLVK